MRLGLAAFLLLWTAATHAVPIQGHKILISGASPEAVQAGRKIALAGGNAVDVAITVALTMSVTSPYFASLGGGGFALVKMDKDVEALDFREVAPGATGPDYYLKLSAKASTHGGHAVAVPGIPAGYFELHKKYGKLPWSRLFSEPLRLARQGFPVSGEWVRKTKRQKEKFNASGLKRFFKKGAVDYKPGEILRQPELAKALSRFRDRKMSGFYSGTVAEDIVKSVKAAGGNMTLVDLKNYKVRWLKPLSTTFEGHTVFVMPPPSSGGVLMISGLKMIERLNVKSKGALSVDEFHLLGEIQARIFRGRALLGDPDFTDLPIARLTSDAYADELVKSLNPKKAVALKPLTESDMMVTESNETTHLSVLDKDGRAVAMTITLNGDYGSGVVSDKFGIALNNEMDDFTTRPGEPNMFGLVQGMANKVEPGKRPLSSMSPTLVIKDGKTVMAIGAPGGPRIISSVFQVLYRVLAHKSDVDLAVQAPRVHHQFLPNKLFVDEGRFSPEILQGLRSRGHEIENGWMGRVYLVKLRDDGLLEGAFDSRGEGSVGGI